MESEPVPRVAPVTLNDAAPLARETVPSVVAPLAKVTEPVGTVVPVAGLTVAVSVVLAVVEMEAGLAASVVVVLTTVGREAQVVASVLASTEPSPVVWS